MLDFLNGVFLAGVMLSSITLYSSDDYKYPADREAVVEVSFHREWWRSDSKCTFNGLMVPFVRDWEETGGASDSDAGVKLEATPDKTAGHAFVINRKICGDKVEPVFHVGTVPNVTGTLYTKRMVKVFDVTEMDPTQRPKWLPQVLQRIERVAAQDEKAKAFMAYNQTAAFPGMPADLVAVLQSGVPATSSALLVGNLEEFMASFGKSIEPRYAVRHFPGEVAAQ